MPRRQLPAQHQQREPSLQSWTDAGYDITTSKQLVGMVAKAFGLAEGEAQKLRPDDQVWSLYRHYYPHRSGWRGWVDSMRPDELEMETLLRDLKRASPSVVVDDLGESATLGELVDLLQRESRRS